MKKFYKNVSIERDGGNWQIKLDGKTVKTPQRVELLVPSQKIAAAIKSEWDRQGEQILPNMMPVTQMMMTVIDRIVPNRDGFYADIINYLDTDMLCYFADKPDVYAAAQRRNWMPVLDWIKDRFGCELQTTTGLAPLVQPAATHEKIGAFIRSLDDLHFSILVLITQSTGSLLLGLAVLGRSFLPDDIFAAAFAEDLAKDEIYLAETYGISPDQEKRRAAIKREIENAVDFLALIPESV